MQFLAWFLKRLVYPTAFSETIWSAFLIFGGFWAGNWYAWGYRAGWQVTLALIGLSVAVRLGALVAAWFSDGEPAYGGE